MERTSFHVWFCGIGIIVLALCGCNNQNPNYDKILQSGKTKISEASGLHSVFTNSHDFLTYFDSRFGDPAWNTKALLNNRYILSFQVSIKVDYTKNEIQSYDAPRIRLSEVASIKKLLTTQDEVLYGQTWFLSIDELKQVLKSQGDFLKVGITLKTNQPIIGIEKIWWGI